MGMGVGEAWRGGKRRGRTGRGRCRENVGVGGTVKGQEKLAGWRAPEVGWRRRKDEGNKRWRGGGGGWGAGAGAGTLALKCRNQVVRTLSPCCLKEACLTCQHAQHQKTSW